MLQHFSVRYSIPAQDRNRAKQFYAEKLGLTPYTEHDFALSYRTGTTEFNIVVPTQPYHADYSLMTWVVDDIEATVSHLRERGVVFEEFDLPYMKSESGIVTFGVDRVAYFRDSENNLLAIAQMG